MLQKWIFVGVAFLQNDKDVLLKPFIHLRLEAKQIDKKTNKKKTSSFRITSLMLINMECTFFRYETAVSSCSSNY